MSARPIVIGESAAHAHYDPDVAVADIADWLREMHAAPLSEPAGHVLFVAPLATSTRFDAVEARSRLKAAEKAECRLLASRFVERVASFPQVTHVWVEFDPGLVLTAVVSERDLAQELQMYAILREVAAEASDPTLGDLVIALAPYTPAGATLLLSQ